MKPRWGARSYTHFGTALITGTPRTDGAQRRHLCPPYCAVAERLSPATHAYTAMPVQQQPCTKPGQPHKARWHS
eukprot:359519-Chlamydomonas_euryale.AAC.2